MEYKRYLNLFNNQNDYESQKNEVMEIPHVVLLEDTNEVIFVSKIDYSKEYFTIEALEEGTVGIGIPSKATSLKYRKNNEPWIETNKAIQLSVVANDTIQISCVSDTCSSLFASSAPFNVKGNIMSLLYGDNFEGETDLSGKNSTFINLFRDCTTLQNAENLILPATTLASKCYYNMFYGCKSLTTAPELPATTLAEYCYSNMFSYCRSLTTAPKLHATTLASSCYSYMFDNCTSLTTAPQLHATTLTDGCYEYMFYRCTSLTTAPELPATTLAEYCYSNMFYGCTNLTTAPQLHATTLTDGCYEYMFQGCKSLTTAPELPATTLENSCYSSMFSGCISLATAPQLLATTLASNCYDSMFAGTNVLPDCSNIDFTSTKVVTIGGLKGLFAGTKVTDADLEKILPKNNEGKCCLPVTTLATWCYAGMFEGCTSLTTAPQLPATTLKDYCYHYMFYGCKSLTTAPELPATTLRDYCYSSMFSYCRSLTTAPKLHATTLASSCYEYMFKGCSNLTTAPELPATTLASNCYYQMFYGCSKLNKIKMLATDISAYNYLTNWVYGVASSGTFVKNAAMTSLPSGANGIPTGWDIQVITPTIINTISTPINFQYIDGIFTPNDKSIDLSDSFNKEELLSVQPECDICVDIVNKNNNTLASDYVWMNSMTLDDVLKELNATDNVFDICILIKNIYEPEYDGFYYYYDIEENFPISFSNNIQCSINGSDWKWLNGNTLSDENTEPFVDGNYFAIETDEGDIYKFKGNLTPTSDNGIGSFTIAKKCDVKGNIMSLLYGDDFEGQTDLTGKDYAFYNLFRDCSNIINANELILLATTLTKYCYYAMFSNCTSLTTAPSVLPATTLRDYCYSNMFENCTSLTTAPELPATTLASRCYEGMFKGCSNLTTAHELHAATLAEYCYRYMFEGCSKLNKIKMLATDISANECLTNWVYGVASSGTFVKNAAMTSLPSGISGIPNGWTVQDY